MVRYCGLTGRPDRKPSSDTNYALHDRALDHDGAQRLEVLASGESFADAKIAYEVAIETSPKT